MSTLVGVGSGAGWNTKRHKMEKIKGRDKLTALVQTVLAGKRRTMAATENSFDVCNGLCLVHC